MHYMRENRKSKRAVLNSSPKDAADGISVSERGAAAHFIGSGPTAVEPSIGKAESRFQTALWIVISQVKSRQGSRYREVNSHYGIPRAEYAVG